MTLLSHRLHENFCRRDFFHPMLNNKAYVLFFAVTVQFGKTPNTGTPKSKSVFESVVERQFFCDYQVARDFTRTNIPGFSRQSIPCAPLINVRATPGNESKPLTGETPWSESTHASTTNFCVANPPCIGASLAIALGCLEKNKPDRMRSLVTPLAV